MAEVPGIAWEDTYDIVQAGYYLDRKEYLSLLEKVLAEIEEQQGLTVIAAMEEEARIFLSGSVIPAGERKLIDIVTQVGGRIVGDDLWAGLIPDGELKIKEITPKGIALGYLNRIPHDALPYLDLASERRLERLKELIRSSKAQGVIYHYSDSFTSKVKESKDILKKIGIPLLEIHTEYAGSDSGAIRTRVEAFVEMIKQRNAV